jgi:hypothetical protein
MKRRLFTILSAVSLLPCVATTMIWEASGFVNVTRVSGGNPSTAGAETITGIWAGGFGYWVVGCSHESEYNIQYPLQGWQFYKVHDPGFLSRPWLRPRCFIWRGCVCIPFWLPFILFLVMPAFVAANTASRIVSDANAKRWIGKCQSCGYDLRTTPGRCPECGAVPAGAAK